MESDINRHEIADNFIDYKNIGALNIIKSGRNAGRDPWMLLFITNEEHLVLDSAEDIEEGILNNIPVIEIPNDRSVYFVRLHNDYLRLSLNEQESIKRRYYLEILRRHEMLRLCILNRRIRRERSR